MQASNKTLLGYRAAFIACDDCAEKQIALRLIRNAIAIPEPDTAWPVERLPGLLDYAKEKTRLAYNGRQRLPLARA